MAERHVRTKIKDCSYTLPAQGGCKLLKGTGRIARFMTGPLGELIASNKDNASAELIANGLRELGQHLDSDEFRAFVFDMLEGLTVVYQGKALPLVKEGETVLFDNHFAGDIGAMIAVICWALKENYGGFFDGFPGAKGLLGKVKAVLKTQLASRMSPDSMTGESPESSSQEKQDSPK